MSNTCLPVPFCSLSRFSGMQNTSGKTNMITECEPRSAAPKSPGDLSSRHAALQRELVAQLERTAARENHWLIYLLLGWEHLAACIASYYLLEVLGYRNHPDRWPHLVVWLSWV